ncbi:MAG: hypothetical protein ACJ8F7_01360 [Gemmataceae bacterium]
MNPYETSATVEDDGRVRVVGVPFAPGTEVQVTIIPMQQSGEQAARPTGETAVPGAGLAWEGDVLVHRGVGGTSLVSELRGADRAMRLLAALNKARNAEPVGPLRREELDEEDQPGDIFAEMRPFMVDVSEVNDSREAIDTRMDGE